MSNDDTDFVDRDYHAARAQSRTTSGTASSTTLNSPSGANSAGSGDGPRRALTREELDGQLAATQQQLTRLREAQDQLERARTAVEELRRRRSEFQTGRTEMLSALTQGVPLLEKAEFNSRRDAEQLAKNLVGLRSALTGLEAINEQNWTEEDVDRQLSRGLGIIHEARMEWNAARMKWPFLDCAEVEKKAENASVSSISTMGLWQACKIGLALTWPISLVLLVALGIFLIFVARRF